jgi:alpha-beta hydrolase superfamily lysophospholipase
VIATTRTELPPGTTDQGSIERYTAPDGAELRFRRVAAVGLPAGTLVYLHGIESHGGWFLPMAARLCQQGYELHLLDRRCAGLNRGVDTGHADSGAQLLDDVRAFRQRLGEHHLVGLSWGGKLALASALRDPGGLRTLTLITPGLVPLVDLSLGQKLRLVLTALVGRRAMFDVPIEPDMFTRTARYLDYIREDALRLERVSNRFLLAGRELDRLIRARIEALAPPTLLFLAGRDRIIDNRRTRALLERAPRGLVAVREYSQATHSIQFDDMEALERDLLAFLPRPRTST